MVRPVPVRDIRDAPAPAEGNAAGPSGLPRTSHPDRFPAGGTIVPWRPTVNTPTPAASTRGGFGGMPTISEEGRLRSHAARGALPGPRLEDRHRHASPRGRVHALRPLKGESRRAPCSSSTRRLIAGARADPCVDPLAVSPPCETARSVLIAFIKPAEPTLNPRQDGAVTAPTDPWVGHAVRSTSRIRQAPRWDGALWASLHASRRALWPSVAHRVVVKTSSRTKRPSPSRHMAKVTR